MGKNFEGIAPAFEENNVSIVLASSAEYAPYLAVTIQSILRNATNENGYDIIVFQKEIPEQSKAQILSMGENYANASIRFFDVSHSIDRNDFNFRDGYTSESFYRVLVHELLPQYKKTIYLDCDVIVLCDIAQLYATDIEGYLLAAAHEPDGVGRAYTNYNKDNRMDYMLNTMKLDRVEDYFQSGVIVFNLEEFRHTFTVQEILEVACAPYIWYGDQDVLNVLCKGRVKYLPMEWNTIVSYEDKTIFYLLREGPEELRKEYYKARKDPKIIHYAGTKPWKVMFADLFPYFWESAIETPFYAELRNQVLAGNEMKVRQNIDYLEEVRARFEQREVGFRYIWQFFLAWLHGKLHIGREGEA